ncbi:hypothetical protein Hs30E_06710 [Lactococcus hodotermopsidis]|uniref:Uncharacterized protein n=1 Tax=Pseudolactococcus hodotermopsidis TaxID=2709157 RepID=A0A6A0B9J6_9LACT|nr:hypothetical protein [Lactococcus hodotermopsidis]GFH42120.1 hypothetical protein Hs30E_06710 [Lactococcus hodotermopsidis]
MTHNQKLESEIISLINHTLNKENIKFAMNLLVSLTTKAYLKDTSLFQNKVSEILNDIATAQADGISAYDFFGNTPKITADKILEAMPNASNRQLFKQALPTLVILFISSLTPTLFDKEINGVVQTYFSLPFLS